MRVLLMVWWIFYSIVDATGVDGDEGIETEIAAATDDDDATTDVVVVDDDDDNLEEQGVPHINDLNDIDEVGVLC